jgi:hypothetical protein
MPQITIDIEVWCSCGQGLCSQSYEKKGGIQVEPCEHCLEKARREAYNEGYEKAFNEAIESMKEEK